MNWAETGARAGMDGTTAREREESTEWSVNIKHEREARTDNVKSSDEMYAEKCDARELNAERNLSNRVRAVRDVNAAINYFRSHFVRLENVCHFILLIVKRMRILKSWWHFRWLNGIHAHNATDAERRRQCRQRKR